MSVNLVMDLNKKNNKLTITFSYKAKSKAEAIQIFDAIKEACEKFHAGDTATIKATVAK